MRLSNGTFSGRAPIEASPVVVTLKASDGFRTSSDSFVLSFTAPALPFLSGANNNSNTLTGSNAIQKGVLGGGNDVYSALGGNDIVLGLTGNDRIDGGTGNDALYGEAITTRFWEALAMTVSPEGQGLTP